MINRIVPGCRQSSSGRHTALKRHQHPPLSDGRTGKDDGNAAEVDIGLLVAVPDYEHRKRHLEWYKLKLLEKPA
jgi:hypothetical protein